jgi:iron complex outermembrane receptor protein
VLAQAFHRQSEMLFDAAAADSHDRGDFALAELLDPVELKCRARAGGQLGNGSRDKLTFLGGYQGIDADARTNTIARGIEGLTITGQGAGRNRIFLRGVADSPFNGATQSTVAVLLDDSRLTYSAPDPDLRLVDVARVEVLKGPQGSLYGTGALGGIYRVVTNRANLTRVSGSASFAVIGIAEGGIGGSGSAVVNLPLLTDRAALRLVG